MNIGIIGGRDFTNYELAREKFQDYFCSHFSSRPLENVKCIVSGGAKGADRIAENIAAEFKLEMKIFPADWETYGKKAGPMRNESIVRESDVLLVFWNGSSKGTASSLGIAKKWKKETIIIYY